MLGCVINVSEGHEGPALDAIVDVGAAALLDVHRDVDHNRAVLTLAGPEVEPAARRVAEAAVAAIDLRSHTGVHPRLGALDVVPFVPLDGAPMARALQARERFARWMAARLAVPCFLYGPERTLPELRRRAFRGLVPDFGPALPHPTAGATAVGARGVLVAYNVWLATADLATARAIAAALRGPAVRALGLAVGDGVQVSMNLIDPARIGPAEAYDLVAAQAAVARAELVGLVPRWVLDAVPPSRWAELDLSAERTIEARRGRRPEA